MRPRPVLHDTEGRQPLPAPSRLGHGLAHWWPYVPALIPLALTLAIVGALVGASHLENFGSGFFSFDFAKNGILIFVLGSFLTSVPALIVAMLVGLGIAIASATYLPRLVSAWLDPFVDLLAGIPSIVYGIWGYFVVAPFFGQAIFPWSAGHLAWIPGFGPTQFSPSPTGDGLALAIIILVLMILPITTVLMRDALRSVPRDLWESGLALGATRWEVNRRVAIPYAKRGIWGAAFLGFGRAIGETVAVFMVIDQAQKIPTNVYDGTSTMSSLIIGTIDSAFLTNAQGRTYLHFLAELALVLLAVTLAVNVAGRWMIRRTYTEVAGL
ncbi:MAG TPA: phosphate ABC transporter permease subunit PstC [Thermoplasmata archaeon]|nr:phosphate ABC transporter permease subunit PstC [Thermoplasmata archaeon]